MANMVPQAVAYAVAVVFVHALLVLAPQRFTGLRSNLRQVVGNVSDRRLRALVRANARNLARSWIDVMRMSRLDRCTDEAELDGLEHLTAALAGGRGVVIVSTHIGPWDAGLVAFNSGAGEIAVLAEVLRPQCLFEHLRQGRAQLGVSVIPIDVAAMREADVDAARRIGAGALRQVVGVLRGNGTVAIAIDRDLTGAGVALPFFGQPTPIPVGVVDIAIRCNAALVPGWSVRRNGRLYLRALPAVAYDPEAPRDAEVRRVAAAVLAIYEDVIVANADQWHVLDPIWPPVAPVRTRGAVLRFGPWLVGLFCAALTAAGMSGWGLGLTSFTTVPDWWVRPAIGCGLASIALLALPRAILWAHDHRARFLAAVGQAAMALTTLALVTGVSGVVVGALRA